MSIQSTTSPAEDTLAEITRLSDRRSTLWELPYRTPEDRAEIASIDHQLAQLWEQRRLALAQAHAAARDAADQQATQRRQAVRREARLVPARPTEISAAELAQLPDLFRRTPLSDDEVRAIRRAYQGRRHGDVTRLALHFGISAATVRAIGQRVSRADVPEEAVLPR
jgi:chorismate mutase